MSHKWPQLAAALVLAPSLSAFGQVSFQTQVRIGATDAVSAILALNVDIDFDTDLIITELVDTGAGRVVVLLNDGAGNFTRGTAANVGLRPFAMATGDFNGDTITDIAVAILGDDQVAVLLGTGLGVFAPPVSFAVGDTPNAISVGEFSGDGNLDILVTNQEADTLSMLVGDGAGGFAAFTTVDASVPAQRTQPKGLATGDFNGDGNRDAAVTFQDRDSVGILLGNGNGTFQAMTLIPVGSDPIGIVAVDLDSNGALDLAVGNSTSDSITVLSGVGNGTFTAGTPFGTGNAPSAIAAVDLNGDSRLDLVTTNREADTIGVHLRAADGSFGALSATTVDGAPVGLAIADFNGDGRLDVATANIEDENVSLLLASAGGGAGDGMDDLDDFVPPDCAAGAGCAPTSFSSLAIVLAGLIGVRRTRRLIRRR